MKKSMSISLENDGFIQRLSYILEFRPFCSHPRRARSADQMSKQSGPSACARTISKIKGRIQGETLNEDDQALSRPWALISRLVRVFRSGSILRSVGAERAANESAMCFSDVPSHRSSSCEMAAVIPKAREAKSRAHVLSGVQIPEIDSQVHVRFKHC